MDETKKKILAGAVIFFMAIWLTEEVVFLEAVARRIKSIEGVSDSIVVSYLKMAPFRYEWALQDETINEVGTESDSSNPYFWLDSGGIFYFENGVGHTIKGDLPEGSNWQRVYAASNPTDTNNGRNPQNLFRLITRSGWLNFEESANFKIDKLNASKSPNRNDSNGIFLLSRYTMDGETLYAAGLRVDGRAVIKKKVKGNYDTVAIEPITGALPLDRWFGLKLVTRNIDESSVSLELFVDRSADGNWEKVFEVTDDASETTLNSENRAGIRSDFMDLEIKDYRISEFK